MRRRLPCMHNTSTARLQVRAAGRRACGVLRRREGRTARRLQQRRSRHASEPPPPPTSQPRARPYSAECLRRRAAHLRHFRHPQRRLLRERRVWAAWFWWHSRHGHGYTDARQGRAPHGGVAALVLHACYLFSNLRGGRRRDHLERGGVRLCCLPTRIRPCICHCPPLCFVASRWVFL